MEGTEGTNSDADTADVEALAPPPLEILAPALLDDLAVVTQSPP